MVWALMLQTGWDAVGLLAGGDVVFTAPGYDVLRALSPFGMRGYGPVLMTLFLATVWAFDRYTRGLGGRRLRICLALLASWYIFWAVGTMGAWLVHWQVLAWPGPARLGCLSAMFLLAARATPEVPDVRGRG